MADWKDIVRTVAPTIGAALGGPMAGVAVQVIGDALMGDQMANEQQVASVVKSANPELLLRLKEADNQFTARMKELEIDVFKVETQDRENARKLFMQNMWPQIVLSGLFIGGYLYLLHGFVTGRMTMDDAIKDAALLLIGIITREVPTIMQFWFGSSFGSKTKDVNRAGRNPA